MHNDPAPVEPAVTAHDLAPGSRTGSDAAWAEAAWRLAAGFKVKEVADFMGCDRTTVWRTLQRSRRLRIRIAEERRCLAHEAGARVASLHHTVAVALEQAVARGDTRVAMWMAERIGLFARDYVGADEGLGEMRSDAGNEDAPPDPVPYTIGAPLTLEPEARDPSPAMRAGRAPAAPPLPSRPAGKAGKANATPPENGCAALHSPPMTGLATVLAGPFGGARAISPVPLRPGSLRPPE